MDFNEKMTNAEESDLNLREGIGRLGLLLLFAVCVVAPSLAYHALGAWAAILACVMAVIAWSSLGPPAFPGLLPGALAVAVFLNSIGWLGFSVYRILRVWLNA